MKQATLCVLAQSASPGGGLIETLIFAVLIFGVLYFLVIRPQKKKEKQRSEMLAKLQKGDRVITIGGIHGEIANVKDKTVILLVDREKGITLKMSRSAIHNVLTGDSAGEEET